MNTTSQYGALSICTTRPGFDLVFSDFETDTLTICKCVLDVQWVKQDSFDGYPV